MGEVMGGDTIAEADTAASCYELIYLQARRTHMVFIFRTQLSVDAAADGGVRAGVFLKCAESLSLSPEW